MVTIPVDETLLLRTFEPSDAADLFDAIDSSRQHLHPWLNWVSKTTKPEHSLSFIEQSHQQLNNQEGLALAIVLNNKIIGGMGMHKWEPDIKRAQIGYWITAPYEGRGIISKALNKFIAYLFEQLPLNKIEIHFVAANKRSAGVAAKLGFTIEGVIRQSFVRNGITEDLVVLGLLKSEWKIQAS